MLTINIYEKQISGQIRWEWLVLVKSPNKVNTHRFRNEDEAVDCASQLLETYGGTLRNHGRV